MTIETRLRVRKFMCDTCIFRPGNKMALQPGRVEGMLAECRERDAYITCHETFDYAIEDESGDFTHSAPFEPGTTTAICKGQAMRFEPTILTVARRMGWVLEVE